MDREGILCKPVQKEENEADSKRKIEMREVEREEERATGDHANKENERTDVSTECRENRKDVEESQESNLCLTRHLKLWVRDKGFSEKDKNDTRN